MPNVRRMFFATLVEDSRVGVDEEFQFGFGVVFDTGGEGVNENALLNRFLFDGNLFDDLSKTSERVDVRFASTREEMIERNFHFEHR